MPRLSLTRKAGESLHIGPSIIVRVISIKGGKVVLSVEAPMDVNIYRGELDERPTV